MASTFININGYEFIFSDKELYNMSVSISNNKKRPILSFIPKLILRQKQGQLNKILNQFFQYELDGAL